MLLSDPEFKNKLAQCVHCGMCLQVCSTYAVLGTETAAPRGRLALMRALAESRLDLAIMGSEVREHLDLCLTCQACQTACPSGVQYGRLVTAARQALEPPRLSLGERLVRWIALRQVMPHLDRLKVLARGLRVYQATGLERLVRAPLVQRILPGSLRAMTAILPPIVTRYRDYRGPAPAFGQQRGRVAFFVGCIQEAFLAPVNEATIRVLQRNGYEVHFPQGQTCCGAAQLHVGERELARDLARRNIDAFLAEPYLAIINNAGGCGATLKEEYEELFAEDPLYAERARQLAESVMDVSEFLAVNLHVPPRGEVRAVATYADSCHLRHVQKVVRQPRDLLQQVPGLRLIELKQPDRCCGSAGIYNIVHSATADAILDLKMEDIAATGAELIVTSNTGCYMQLQAGVRRAGLKARIVNVAQVLDMSYLAEVEG
jgi:glycolate oxidase iron-sulfur subunit